MRPMPVRGPGRAIAILAGLLCTGPLAWSGPAARPPGFTLGGPGLAPSGRMSRQHVYDQNGCGGGNVSPALRWRHPPAGTRSFAVLMFDPDAPGRGWWHWLAFDIPARTRDLPAGAGHRGAGLMPSGTIQSRNDFGFAGYGGPCPPPGPPHHYHIMLFALSVRRLGLDTRATPAQVNARVHATAIAEAEITVLYGR